MSTDFKAILLSTNCFIDNVYLELYIDLIIKNINTKKIKFVTQAHHIIPKCIYNISTLTIYDDQINLKYSDHMLAHYYLCLASSCDYLFAANYKAIKWIFQHPKSWNSNIELRDILLSELNTFKDNLDKFDYIKQKANNIISQQAKNRVRIYKDLEMKSVPRDLLELYIRDGWIRGIPDAIVQKTVANRKLKVYSEATRQKMSEAHKGKPSGMKGKHFSPATLKLLSEKHSGENNGFYGKHHSEQTKKILSEQKLTTIPIDIRNNIVKDFKDNFSINKLRFKYGMCARKILRILYEENLISKEYLNTKYKI